MKFQPKALADTVQIPTIPAIWQLSKTIPQSSAATAGEESIWHVHSYAITCILLFISASRLGRWTNVMSTQQLAQSCVQPDQRSTFGGTEAGLASMFGLGHWGVTAVWSSHSDFKWAACGSLLVVAGSTCLHAFWLMGRGSRSFPRWK